MEKAKVVQSNDYQKAKHEAAKSEKQDKKAQGPKKSSDEKFVESFKKIEQQKKKPTNGKKQSNQPAEAPPATAEADENLQRIDDSEATTSRPEKGKRFTKVL
mmetsp:Transcript_11437/g.19327  ORF Transcript_11437/g.19327 Transcript_11437/m.19327 type:complete len:102 (+) Transcript_11437:1195-1500(+)